jgi:hypothetical protein
MVVRFVLTYSTKRTNWYSRQKRLNPFLHPISTCQEFRTNEVGGIEVVFLRFATEIRRGTILCYEQAMTEARRFTLPSRQRWTHRWGFSSPYK